MTITFTATLLKSKQTIKDSSEFYNKFAWDWHLKLDVGKEHIHVDGFLTGNNLEVSKTFDDISECLKTCDSLIVRDNIGSYKIK